LRNNDGMNRLWTSLFVCLLLLSAMDPAAAQAAAETSPTHKLLGRSPARAQLAVVEAQVERLLAQLSETQKLDLIGGTGAWDIKPVPQLNLPRIYGSDSAAGIRQSSPPGVSYPASIMLAATWNPARARAVGQALGRDAQAAGFQAVLGPGMNLNRIAYAGRQAEYGAGEDPFLGAVLMPAMINGIQSQGVWATAKHLVANDQELNRLKLDVRIDERTLREVYLLPFEAAVKNGQVASIMCAFNKLNALYACENQHLLSDIVKRDWGFQGFIESDYDSVIDGVAGARAGTDLDMPAGNKMNRATLQAALLSGALPQATLDDKLRRILRQQLLFGFDKARASPITSQIASPIASVPAPGQHKKLRNEQRNEPRSEQAALDAAREGIVLLQNRGRLLPLSGSRALRIAVIGHRALGDPPKVYGSAYLPSQRFISVLDGLRAGAANGSRIDFIDSLSLVPATTVSPQGFVGRYFNDDRFEGAPLLTRTDARINFDWSAAPPPHGAASIEWTGQIVAQVSGEQVLKVRADGAVQILVNGVEIASNGDGLPIVAGIPPTIPVSGRMTLAAGVPVQVQVRYARKPGYGTSLGAFTGVQLSWAALQPPPELANYDAVVIAAGLGSEYEGEGFDRPFAMPEHQSMMIAKVAAANPRTIVLIHAGGGVALRDFANQVGALLYVWYPGQVGGQAIADVLFGKVNPSGKLPITLDAEIEDNPAFASFPPQLNDNGALEINYSEGAFIGYKGYERSGRVPLFPFGYGLSYTSFEYSNFAVAKRPMRCAAVSAETRAVPGSADEMVLVSFDIKNIGTATGAEIAQVYVGQDSPPVARPKKELKGFAKVLLAPGQRKRVNIALNPRAFAYFDDQKNAWVVDAANFRIDIGGASNALAGQLVVRRQAQQLSVRTSAPTTMRPLAALPGICFD
jgi:beta-glucosidase